MYQAAPARTPPAADWFRREPEIEVSPWIDCHSMHPDFPQFVIGDVHGHADALSRLLDEMARLSVSHLPVSFLGDLGDRGPDSLGVILEVVRPDPRFARKTLIAGNHDLYFLEADLMSRSTGSVAQLLGFWSQVGGDSFLNQVDLLSCEMAHSPFHVRLETGLALRGGTSCAVARERLESLHGLPLGEFNGNVLMTHAGLPPDIESADLPAFLDRKRASIEYWWNSDDDFPFIVHPEHFQATGQPSRSGAFVIHGHYPEFLTYTPRSPLPSLDLYRHDPGMCRLGLDGTFDTFRLCGVVGAQIEPGRYRVFRAPVMPGARILDDDA